jgi:toxin ParE1/3/4
MSLPLVVRTEAEEDLVDARDWYERQQPGLGSRFIHHVSAALDRIQDRPEMYSVTWEDVRSCRLRRFPFLVYYRILADRIEVLAVLHGSREPSVWHGRS